MYIKWRYVFKVGKVMGVRIIESKEFVYYFVNFIIIFIDY